MVVLQSTQVELEVHCWVALASGRNLPFTYICVGDPAFLNNLLSLVIMSLVNFGIDLVIY